jgi:RNA polymerase sigma-70 factor (ECF subfamily)
MRAVASNDATVGREYGAAKATLYRDIETFLPNIRRYARSLTRNAVDADDLVQECVTRALTKLHLWKAGTDLRAWLIRILHNQYVSQVRRATLQSPTVEWSKCVAALTCGPYQIEHLHLREVVQALRSLPQEQRTAVLMIGLSRGDYYEVASACKVPVGTIRSRLSRGRARLRKRVGAASEQGQPQVKGVLR